MVKKMDGCGLDQPFEVLSVSDETKGPSLPDDVRAAYGGDWKIPDTGDRPYTYSNFVVPRDGRVSYNMPGHMGGGDISAGNLHDRWLMALLRARADAVFMGDNTLRLEPEHLWTTGYIFPEAHDFFETMRKDEGRAENPIQCFVSLNGEFDPQAHVFRNDLDIVIATTENGAQNAKQCGLPQHVKIVELGIDSVDTVAFVKYLKKELGVQTALCEGGPGLYANCLKDGSITDEFLSLAPFHLGEDRNSPRPSLLEGVGFAPGEQPVSELKSVRRVGNFLYIHSRFQYQISENGRADARA